MEKISHAQIAEVLTDASAALRAQQAYIGELETKIASKDQRDRVEKIAHEMHRKGIELDTGVEELANRLEKAAEAGKLDAVEQAVDFVGPDMGQKLASITHDESGSSPGASSDLERFIVGAAG